MGYFYPLIITEKKDRDLSLCTSPKELIMHKKGIFSYMYNEELFIKWMDAAT